MALLDFILGRSENHDSPEVRLAYVAKQTNPEKLKSIASNAKHQDARIKAAVNLLSRNPNKPGTRCKLWYSSGKWRDSTGRKWNSPECAFLNTCSKTALTILHSLSAYSQVDSNCLNTLILLLEDDDQTFYGQYTNPAIVTYGREHPEVADRMMELLDSSEDRVITRAAGVLAELKDERFPRRRIEKIVQDWSTPQRLAKAIMPVDADFNGFGEMVLEAITRLRDERFHNGKRRGPDADALESFAPFLAVRTDDANLARACLQLRIDKRTICEDDISVEDLPRRVKSVPELVKIAFATRDYSNYQQYKAMLELGRIGDAEAIAALNRGLWEGVSEGEHGPEIVNAYAGRGHREAAAFALSKVWDGATGKRLIDLVMISNQTHDDLRLPFFALECIGTDQVKDTLRLKFHSDKTKSNLVKVLIAKCLAALGDHEALEWLVMDGTKTSFGYVAVEKLEDLLIQQPSVFTSEILKVLSKLTDVTGLGHWESFDERHAGTAKFAVETGLLNVVARDALMQFDGSTTE